MTIITDPVFRMLGIHQAPKSYTFERMPRPDLVFISHTHVDHFAPSVLKRLPPDTPVWMPAEKVHKAPGWGLKALRGVRGLGIGRVQRASPDGRAGQTHRRRAGPGRRGRPDRLFCRRYLPGPRTSFARLASAGTWTPCCCPLATCTALGMPFGHIGPQKAPQALWLLGEPRVVVPTHYSGMTLGPLMTFGGTPRKLSQAIHKAELGIAGRHHASPGDRRNLGRKRHRPRGASGVHGSGLPRRQRLTR